VLNDNEQLQLSPLQLESAIEKSRKYWYRLTALAVSHHRQGSLPSPPSPRYLLGRVPAICGSLGQIITSYPDSYQGRVLCVDGFSTWKLANSSCELHGEKTVPGFLRIGTQKPAPCRFGGEGLSHWPWVSGERKQCSNYLGVLALGWSYILSARLGEILEAHAAMTYTSSMAVVYSEVIPEDASNTVVDLGDV
jgi:hypothetical protein